MLLHVCRQPKRADGTGGGRGKRVGGVLRYLFGPGREEEHVNARFGESARMGTPYGRLIAASGGKPISELQPQPTARGCFDYRPLVQWLEELPRAAGVLRRVDGRHQGPGWVWHASMRLAPEDRHRQLTDETWAQMVREMLRGAGLIVDGDEAGVRWVVVRHAEDHVHIVASLVRADGRREWFRNDFLRCVDATREVAARMGLRQVARAGGTVHRRPHPVETHKAARQGRFTADGGVLTVRDELRRRVRAAAAATGSPEAFVAQLREQGVRVEFRQSEVRPGERTGVKFALAADSTAAGTPVWYSGGRLAPDLTWPRLRARWSTGTLPGLESTPLVSNGDRRRLLAEADRVVRRAATRMRRGGEADAVTVGQAAADCMTAGAWLLDRRPDGRLVRAAERLDAATRQPAGHQPPTNRDAIRLHVLAQALFALRLTSDDEDERQALLMMYSLCSLAERIARIRDQQHRADQAAHARAAVAEVRGQRRTSLRERGRRLAPAVRARQADLVRQVLPGQGEQIVAEPAWDALAATLHDIEAQGGDPRHALRVAAGWRGLAAAASATQVLVWRLRRAYDAGHLDPAAPGTSRPGRTRRRVPRHTAASGAAPRPGR